MTGLRWVLASCLGIAASVQAQSDPVLAASTFLDGLDAPARATALLPVDHPDRYRWGRSPAPRTGIRLGDLSERQRTAAHAVLRSVLSERGVEQVLAIMAEQDRFREEGMGSGFYWLVFYGRPTTGRPWGFRFGGHHVSVHAFLDGSRVTSLTPLMLGAETLADPALASMLTRRDVALSIARSVPADLRKRMLVSVDDLSVLELNPGRADSGTVGELDANLLSPALQQRLSGLVLDYAASLQLDILANVACLVNPRSLRFAWAGSNEPFAPHYYRIAGEGFVIEYINHGRHMHSLLRTSNDFGTQVSPAAGLSDAVSCGR